MVILYKLLQLAPILTFTPRIVNGIPVNYTSYIRVYNNHSRWVSSVGRRSLGKTVQR